MSIRLEDCCQYKTVKFRSFRRWRCEEQNQGRILGCNAIPGNSICYLQCNAQFSREQRMKSHYPTRRDFNVAFSNSLSDLHCTTFRAFQTFCVSQEEGWLHWRIPLCQKSVACSLHKATAVYARSPSLAHRKGQELTFVPVSPHAWKVNKRGVCGNDAWRRGAVEAWTLCSVIQVRDSKSWERWLRTCHIPRRK